MATFEEKYRGKLDSTRILQDQGPGNTKNPGRLYSGKKEEEDGLDTASARARQLVQARQAAMERANARAQEIRQKRTVRDLGTGSAREERLQTSQQAAASRLHAENRRANAGFTTFARGNAVTQTSEMDTGRALAEGLNRSGMDMQTRGEAAAESQRRASALQKQLTNQEKVLQNVYDAYMKAPSEELYNGYQNLYKRYENTKQAYALYAEKFQKDAQEYREAEKFYALMQQEAEKQQRKQDAEMGVETGEDGKRRIVDFEKYNAAAGINPETLYTGADARAADEALEPYTKQLEYWQRNGTKDRKTQQAVQNSMNALKDAYIDNPQATTAQRDKARQLLAQMDALENIGNADALTYTAAQLPLGMEGQIRGVTSLAGTAIGDLATGGKTSDDFKALTDFLAANPAYEKLVFESGTAADFVARKAGVSPASVKAYREANVNAYNTQKVSDYYEGVSDTYKETAGRMAYSVGQQLPSMLLTMGGGEMIGSISQRAASGAITEAAAKTQMAAVEALSKSISVGLMSVGAAGNTLTERANESGYSLANYAYAAATGATEAATEYMLGTTGDVASYQLKVRGVRELFQNALEEGIEEMLGYPIESAADWLFASSKSVDEWVDKITKNSVLDKMSVKEWLQSGIEGFAVGGLMGVSGLVLNSDSGDYDSTGFDRRIKGYAGRESVDYFADMADMEQLNARYEQLRAVYGTRGTDPDTRKMARINNQYISRVGYTAMRAYMEKNGIDMTPAREKLVPVEQKKSASGMETQSGNIRVEAGPQVSQKEQTVARVLADNIQNINDMEAVEHLTGREMNDKKLKPSEQIAAFFKKIGNKIQRNGFGEVILDDYGVRGEINHRPLNRAKMVTIEAVPAVIQKGRVIKDVDDWKGRGYRSITFAAPVEVAGTPVYVAAVVNQHQDNKFYLHECVDSNGNYVRIETDEAGNTKSRVTAKSGITTMPETSVSDIMVPQGESGVKENYARAAEENTEVRAENAQTSVQAEPVTLIPDTQAARMTEARDANMKRAARLRQRVADAEAEIASPYELGVKNGETEVQNRVIPESIARRDAAMQEARQILQDAGYQDTGFVTGPIERYGGTDHFALTKSGKVLIQADSVWNTPQDIARAFIQENGKGEVQNGSEVYDGNEGRVSGERTGGETGQLAEGAGRGAGIRSAESGNGTGDSQTDAGDARTSARKLGIDNGADTGNLRIVQPAADGTYADANVQAAEDFLQKLGMQATFVKGKIFVRNPYTQKVQSVTGAVTADGRIIIRTDAKVTALQLAKHEAFHMLAETNPGLRQQVLDELFAEHGEEKVLGLAQRYVEGYAGIYGAWETEPDAYIDEMLADAYAGINRTFARAAQYEKQVNGYVEREGLTQGEGGRGRFSFARENDAEVRAEAERMEAEGRTPEEIWRALGVARTMDGRDWRYEIDDSGMKYDKTGDAQGAVSRRWAMEDLEAAKADMKAALTDNEMKDVRKYNSARVRGDEAEMRRLYEQNAEKYGNVFTDYVAALDWAREFSVQVSDGMRLGDFLKHDALFEAYPRLKGVELRFEKLDDGTRGAYNREENSITLDSSLRNAPESTLIHEIQHAIQDVEGFAGGSSPEYWARRDYENDDFVTERLQREYDRTLNGLSHTEQNKYIRYTELEGELERLFLSDENSEDGKRYAKLEAEQDALYEELYPNQWFRDLLDLNRRMNDVSGEYRKMYNNTAGEIEARDAAERRNLTAEQRREKMPRAADENTVFADGNGKSYSIGEIVGDDQTNYGIGVHLDSTLLENLTSKERTEMVKERVEELGGEKFTAYDNAGNAVDISIAKPKDRFRNRNGKRKPVNKDLTVKYIGNETKQESVVLLDELIETASFDKSKTPTYSHGWLDNNGKNNWDYWTTYVQDKNGTIWDVTLNIANATDGRKILYDIGPIKKVGQSIELDTSLLPTGQRGNSRTSTVKMSVAENAASVKGKFSASDTTADPVPEYLHEIEEALRENSAVNYTPGTLETLLEQKGLTAEEIEASGIMDIAEDARHQTGRPVGTIDAEALKEYVRIKMNAYRKYTETGIHPATETEMRNAELKARRKLRSELLGLFPVQQQNRAEVSQALEDFANWYMSGGERIEKDALWTHTMALFDTMWKSAREMDESGAEVYGPAATMMKGMKLDVPESVRADFGDDWGDVRRALFGVGIYTTQKGLPLDSAYAELSAVHPGIFDEHELDGKAQLEKILEIAQEARPKAMTLEETAQRNGVDVDAMMSEYLMGTTVAIGDYMTALGDMRESWKTGVPTGMSIDDYLEYRDRSAREDAQERAKTIARENFRATPAMDRLGIRIDNSVTDYGQAMALKELNRARRQAERKAQKEAERRGATRAERQAARAIARGDMRLTDYRFGGQLKQETVKALSELYAAVESFNADAIAAHKRGVKEQLREQMGKLIGKQLPRKKLGMAAMNYMTPKRIMAELFGDAGGKQVYDEVFRSVARNGGEMIRWVQGQKDKVKRFEGADGKARKLSAGESRIVQMMMEGRGARDSAAKLHEGVRDNILNAAADIYGKLRALNENKRSYKKAAQAAMDDARAEYGLNADELRLAYQASRMNEAETLVKELGLDAVKLQNAANTYREMFDGYYDAINDFLVVHGYEPIGFVKGYTPHMQSEESLGALTKALQLLGGTEDVSSLPVDIAGLTQDFKPGKKYDPYFLQRTGVLSSYDIQAAFDSYLDYLGQVFFRTDDIMRVRALSSYIRENYAPESLRDILDWDASLGEMPAEVKRDWLEEQGAIARDSQMTDEEVNEKFDEYREQITEDAAKNSQYGNLVMWLDNYANILAGKQSAADRGNEQLLGRRTANIANKMTGMTGAALVGANMSSVLNQTSQLAFILGENRTSSVVKALGDMMTRRTRGWDVQSDFLAGKDGVDLLAKDTKGMIDESLFSILTLSDRLVATLAVRTRYIEEIRKGADAETAMDRADDWARDMMGSRMKGERPLAFESKRPLVRAVNMFQTEVLNSWEHVALDMPQEIRNIERTKGRKKAALAAANLIIKTLISAFVMNRLADELYGGTPAMFDVIGLSGLFVASGQGMTENDWIRKVIDNGLENLGAERIFGTAREGEKEFDWKAAQEDTFYNITNDLPLVRNVAGLLGWGDETLPTMQMDELLDYVRDMIAGATEGNLRGVTDSTVGLLSNVIPGGRQLQKTYQGARIMAEGGRYKGKDDSLQLMYPVDATVTDWIRALLFGRAGVDAEGEYWASGEKALSTGQTELYREMVGKGADGQEVYSVILDWRAAANDKELDSAERGKREREALKQADLTDGEKLEMYRGLANADSRSEDFRKIMDTGVSFNRTMELYDAYKALYDREDMTAGEKATEFAVWLDGQDYDAAQKTEIRDVLKYYSMVPAEAGRYDKLTDAGLGIDAAERMTKALAALEPEEGKENVSVRQQYRAVLDSDLTDGDKAAAIGTLMDSTDEYTEKGELSQWGKFKKVLDSGLTLEDWYDMYTEEQLDNFCRYMDEGISGEAAMQTAEALDELKDQYEGTDENPKDIEKWRAIALQPYDEFTKSIVLEKMMDEEAYAKYRGARDAGMSTWQYVDFKDQVSYLEADKDANGKTIRNSLKNKVVKLIDSMDISGEAKDYLYLNIQKYAKSGLGSTPWH